MSSGKRGLRAARAGLSAAVALACQFGSAAAGDLDRKSAAPAQTLPAMLASGSVAVETVIFADQRHAPVRVVRGLGQESPPAPGPIPAPRTEIVSFGSGFADQVTVIRGGGAALADVVRRGAPPPQARVETVAFADPRQPAVTVVRGAAARDMFYTISLAPVDLFAPASGGELDRVAFAVDGVESRHGSDLRMWRPGLDGPQGPMQISAAAALDVGGGDRFDLHQNRLLGRAYLAQMYERYGNWADAIAAYNWGPGNMDQWIGGGRNVDHLPISVVRYTNRVLRDALLTAAVRL